MKWIKQFCIKVFHKVEDHVAGTLASILIVIVVVSCSFFWGWLKRKYSLEMYAWTWLLVLSIFLLLIAYSLYHILRDKGRLKNEHDIIYAIENWFTKGDIYGESVEENVNYYFSGVEKDLNLRRGSSKRYLPMIAFRHGYAFEMGKKTFKLNKLTLNNDPTTVLEKYLKPLENGEKEIILRCNNIGKELAWPEEATKHFLLSQLQKNVNFGIEIEDIGRDKIRIIRKV
jgi:hypothetical protein